MWDCICGVEAATVFCLLSSHFLIFWKKLSTNALTELLESLNTIQNLLFKTSVSLHSMYNLSSPIHVYSKVDLKVQGFLLHSRCAQDSSLNGCKMGFIPSPLKAKYMGFMTYGRVYYFIILPLIPQFLTWVHIVMLFQTCTLQSTVDNPHYNST